MANNIITMPIEKMANILYNIPLGLDYADGIDEAEEEIRVITKQLELLKENKCDSLLAVLDYIATQNAKLENWHINIRPDAKKDRALKRIIDAVHRALDKYSSANVDVVRNQETDMLDVVYHSRHNSFGIESDVAYYDDVDLNELESELDDLDVGYVW